MVSKLQPVDIASYAPRHHSPHRSPCEVRTTIGHEDFGHLIHLPYAVQGCNGGCGGSIGREILNLNIFCEYTSINRANRVEAAFTNGH